MMFFSCLIIWNIPQRICCNIDRPMKQIWWTFSPYIMRKIRMPPKKFLDALKWKMKDNLKNTKSTKYGKCIKKEIITFRLFRFFYNRSYKIKIWFFQCNSIVEREKHIVCLYDTSTIQCNKIWEIWINENLGESLRPSENRKRPNWSHATIKTGPHRQVSFW